MLSQLNGWYEGFSNKVSQNDGLQSRNGLLKIITFRKKLGLSDFISTMESTLNLWSVRPEGQTYQTSTTASITALFILQRLVNWYHFCFSCTGFLCLSLPLLASSLLACVSSAARSLFFVEFKLVKKLVAKEVVQVKEDEEVEELPSLSEEIQQENREVARASLSQESVQSSPREKVFPTSMSSRNGRVFDSGGASQQTNWTMNRSPKCGEELLMTSLAQSMSPLAHEYKSGGNAGVPLSKVENPEGKKVISNGISRVHRLLTDEEIAQGRQSRWTELEIHGRIRNISLPLLEMRHLTALFLGNNLLTRIPPEISQLCNLTLLDLSNNKLRSLPAEIGDMISLCHLYLNSNQIRVLPYELGKLFRLQTFALQQNPLSPDISKIYHDVNGDKKLLQHLLDHLAINTAPPPERQWIVVRPSDPEKPIATFTVLCYNVLCDKYATTNLYSYCPQWALNWEYRKQYIIKEICHYDADIITLQEVETEQFRLLFQPKLEAVGYTGLFFPKSRSKTMNEEEKRYVDGCAIFWKFDKFEMERNELFELGGIKVAMEKAQAHENMLNRVMPRDNIALAVVLRIKENLYNNHSGHRLNINASENVVGNMLVVCTAHIHWDPEFCDVKLIQSMMLVHELNKVLEKVAAKHHLSTQQVPVLICGDFNSLPESGVFEYLSKGAIAKDHPDLKNFRDDTCLNRLSASPDDNRNFTHALRLDSAVDPSSHIKYTNYTLDFKGMIDYIFATPQSLARLGILGPLDMSWVTSNKFVGFPQPHVPSDHIPIMAQYAVIPTSFQRALPQIQHYGTSHSGGFGAIGR